MTLRAALISAIILAVSSPLQADEVFLTAMRQEAERHQWRQIDLNMTSEEYRESFQHNRRLVRDTLRSTVTSLGVAGKGAGLMGAAIALAVDDSRLHLNKNKTMAFEFKDLIEEDRRVDFRINLDW